MSRGKRRAAAATAGLFTIKCVYQKQNKKVWTSNSARKLDRCRAKAGKLEKAGKRQRNTRSKAKQSTREKQLNSFVFDNIGGGGGDHLKGSCPPSLGRSRSVDKSRQAEPVGLTG